MVSKRLGFITGGLLTGALLLGTAGLALAQDPTSTPTASPSGIGQMGAGMMGGQMGAAMMGGHNGTGMMGGQNGTGMMGGQMGAGMMGGQMGTMGASQLKQMATLHDKMVKTGDCDFSQMQALHVQHHPGR